MAVGIEAPIYVPPDKSVGNISLMPLDLGEGHSLLVRQHTYRGLIVDFAIMQLFSVDGDEFEIARIDCCWGTVHRHVFDRKGNDMMDHQEIKRIVSGPGAWETVNAEFEPCYERMMTEFMENHRRWAN